MHARERFFGCTEAEYQQVTDVSVWLHRRFSLVAPTFQFGCTDVSVWLHRRFSLVAPAFQFGCTDEGGSLVGSKIRLGVSWSGKTSRFAKNAARFFSREARFFSRAARFFSRAGRTEMSQALGHLKVARLSHFLNFSFSQFLMRCNQKVTHARIPCAHRTNLGTVNYGQRVLRSC